MAKAKIDFHKSFDSWGDFVRGAQDTRPAQWDRRESRAVVGGNWAGTKDFAEACTLAAQGWPMGRAKMMKAVQVAALATGTGQTPSHYMDVAGAYPIAALAAAGDPAAMVNLAAVEERARPIVRLVMAGSVSAMISEDSIFNYGAALLAFIDGLEQADIRAELNLCFAFQRNAHKSSYLIRLKEAGEVLDLDRLAFALSNAATLRRLMFAHMEMDLPNDYGGTYGTPRDPVEGRDFESGSILLPTVQSFRTSKLATPLIAFHAMAPTILDLLAGRGDFPPIRFDLAA
jgi:hypothetical protein